jgi:hypothetical protein
LTFICTRRNFFKALLQETIVVIKTAQGGQSFRLAELGSMQDEQLARIAPAMNNQDYEICIEEGQLCTRHKRTGKTFKEFPLLEENRLTFNLFNGRNTLEQIAGQLSQELGWTEAQAFAHVRGLFLSLANHLVCQPRYRREQDGS